MNEQTVMESDAYQRIPVESISVTVNKDAREIEVVVSTSDRDRQGDVIESSGLDFTSYMCNPVVLWAHDQQRPPVGKVVCIKPGNQHITAVIRFANTEFAEEIFQLYCDGYLNAWSLGFIPRKWKRLAFADGSGMHVTEAEVVEISAVPVPANPQALSVAMSRVKNMELKSILQKCPVVSIKNLAESSMELISTMVNEVMDHKLCK